MCVCFLLWFFKFVVLLIFFCVFDFMLVINILFFCYKEVKISVYYELCDFYLRIIKVNCKKIDVNFCMKK